MWLLEGGVWQQIERAQAAGLLPTADQLAHFEASHGSVSADNSRILVVAGRTAQIEVQGVLTQKPDWIAAFFGGGNTTYGEIIAALAEADANTDIDQIILAIDSPGGQVSGLFDAIAALQTTKTPTRAVVGGMAASAAFALAVTADKTVATSRAAIFGSVGVVQGFRVNDDIIEITSTNAPKKRPDVTTPEGVAAVREELDPLHDLFVETIAAGTGVSMDKVNADFGQGATLLADEALKRGMIDSIEGPRLSVVTSATTSTAESGQPEARKMDLSTLKAEHPAVYKAAVDAGIALERDRAGAHLTMGEMSGDMKTAIACAIDGSEMTQVITAKHMMATANRRDMDNRGTDEATTAAAADAVSATDAERDEIASDSILAQAAEICGIEMGA